MRKRDEFEDDGRTIADMSGIVPQRTFLPRRKPREDAPSGEGFDLTPKEKRWAALGAARDSVFDLAMNHFPPGPQGPGGFEFMLERLEILKSCEADCIFRKSMLT